MPQIGYPWIPGASTGLPTRQQLQPFFDLTKLVAAGTIVYEHDFSDGKAHGWVPLFTPLSSGGTNWGSLNCVGRGSSRLMLRSPDTSGVTSIGVYRTSRGYYGDGRYLVEFVTTIENATASVDRPGSFAWGLDTAKVDGTRRFPQIIFLNYDEVGASQVQKFRLDMGGGIFQDVVGGGSTNLMNRANENKDLPHYLAFEFDSGAGTYRGFRFNDEIKVGTLATLPDNTLVNYGPMASSSLTSFAGGLNVAITITNRNAASVTRGAMSVHWNRLTYLGT